MSEGIIICIKNRRYLEAANLIIKSVLKDKIHTLGQHKRRLITNNVAKMIKDKHQNLRSWYSDMNIKPLEIAKEVYNDIMLELASESKNTKNLTELDDD